ncbi:amino acid adenylation domain-containing protein [Kitasatospora sp. NPDC098663]|uniref:amino acid adenylation domain-containing protein n=1 Tax=Kitasatospora sp. NPDC098663 TaxID=3364096 RepID=UPI00381E7312
MSPTDPAHRSTSAPRSRPRPPAGTAPPGRAAAPEAGPPEAEPQSLTGAQAGIWYAQQRDPASPAYLCAEYVELAGPLDERRFTEALRTTLAQAQTLWLRFAESGADALPVAVLGAPRAHGAASVRVDLTAEPEPHAAALAWMRADLTRPIDLATGPLFGTALIRLGPEHHLWYLKCHHISLDAYGFGLLQHRLAELYSAPEGGLQPPERFAPLTELLAEEDEYRRSAQPERDRAFWRERLAGLPAPVTLAAGSAPPSATPVSVRAALPPAAQEALARAGAGLRAPRAEIQLAVVAAYLHRVTGRTDLTLGLPFAGRFGSVAARVPADTVNVLPLPLTVDPGMSGAQLVAQVARRLREVRPYSRLRGEELRRELRLGATDRLTGPLVNVGLVSPSLRFAQLRARVHPLAPGPIDDLTISFRDDADGRATTVDLDGNPALHSAERLSGHHDRLLGLLAAFTARPDRAIATLDTFAERERAAVPELAPAESRRAPEPPGPTIPELFREQAAAHPEAIALVAGEERLTYRELADRVARLAGLLRDRGAGREQVVALALPRSADLVVAVLAVLSAGAGYLPIDPYQPAARTGAVLRAARPLLLVTDLGHATRHPAEAAAGGQVPVLVLDSPGTRAELARRPATAPAVEDAADTDCAYVLHTSGSTGEPKGVVLEHRNVVRLLRTTAAGSGFGPADTWTLFHSYAFDFSVWELFGALLHGGRLVVVPFTVSRSPEEFLGLLVRERVTVLNLTPSAFEQLVQADRDLPHLGDALSLRQVVLGGEALRPAVLADWYRRHPDTAPRITNMYGITETTVHVTSRHLTRADADPGATGLIGEPLPDLRVRLLDAALRPVPPGEVGEIHVAGPGLARGYLGRPALTAERFLPDPYGPPGSRMYRSGDLARRDAQGRLEYLGRFDDQIKIRGFRIEPGEVAAALARHPVVRQAAVTARSEAGGARLVAYVVPRRGERLEPAELRRHAAELLPEHLRPAAVVVLDALPLTGNGKLDLAALPAPAAAGPSPGRDARGPREQVLCELFADLLGADRVGPEEDFFALGGHSLLATRMVGRIRAALGAAVGVRDLFEAPTPAALAARLDHAAAERPRLTARPRPERPPLSYAQRGLWFLHRMEGPSATYNIPLALRLTGPLDVPALRRALNDLVARHESLRTLLVADGDEPGARVLAAGQAEVELDLLTARTGRPVSAELAAATRYAFDLAGELPLRARLLRVDESEHVLLLLLHHTAGDDWSQAPLARDLAAAYGARLDGAAPAFAPLPVQYSDYALWQRDLLAPDSALFRNQLGYWKERLADLPDHLELPTDRPRPAVSSHRGAAVPVHLDAELHRGLRALARHGGATVFMALQAGLTVLLTRLGAGTDIPLGCPVAGRQEGALDDLIGLFANTLVLRTDTSGDPTFRELLTRVRKGDLADFDHQELPFERLVEELGPVRSPSRHPLFQLMISYGSGRRPVRLPGLDATALRPHNGSAKFDLTLSLADRPEGDGIDGFLEYALDLFDEAGVRVLVERLVRLLRQAVDAPDRPISTLEVLADPERRRIVHEWNDTDAPVDPRAFPAMFEEQARRAPDRLALVAGPHRLTYGQVNVLANRLAHHLVAIGVGPERTVGIHLPRSAELVIGLLAVQKAGGAFVPLDPGWPPARIAGLAADAGLTAALTSPGGAGLPDHLPGIELALDGHGPGGWFADRPEHDPEVVIDPESLAYVIYTSGSTGTPKGAMIRHRAISNRLPWQIGLLGLTPEDPVLHKAPLTFDISVNEIFLPWAAGAPLVVAEAGREGDVAHLLELIERERIAFVYLVSSILDIMLERPDVSRAAASLKHVWCGGEVLTPELFARFRERLGPATMYHGYGPAETTIGVTCQVYRGAADQGITIGRPNPNTRVYVLDPAMRPVPVGVPGELYLGGVPLGRGYLGDPCRTAAAFVPDPFSGRPGARLYRSGDLARYRADGNIEFLGRADNQVKIHGVRVELEEIESVLSRHPAVRQAVVLVLRGAPGGDRLAAWCTPDPKRPRPDPADLRDWMLAVLPEYLVPREVRVVAALPLMSSGKVDRKALAGQALRDGRDGPPEAVGHRAPAEGTERLIAEVWSAALGLERIGAESNFFDLGGHSLLLARVQTGLRARLGWDVPVLDLFTRPTIAQLARHLDSRDGRAPESAAGAGSREALEVLLPLRTGGGLAPLFCVHPASGLSWPFAGLRPHLDPRRPLYGLQSRTLLGRPVPESLEELADEYLERVREVQPAGPYHLVGWSFGGVIAHTMATRLQQRGERVALLAMLDSYPRYPWRRLARDHRQQALRSLLHMSHYDLSRLDGTRLDRAEVLRTIAEQGGVLAELAEDTIQGVMDGFVSSAELQQRVEHQVFHGDLLFFTATVDPVDPALSHRDWKPHLDGTIENHGITCEHKDMTRSGPLAEIGRRLDRRLRDLAEAGEG